MLSGFYENSREKHHNKIITLSQRNELLATMDPLTSLPNRRYTMDKLKEFKSGLSGKKIPLVLMLCDVDNFKKVNDKYGHSFGDEALIHLARVLEQSTPNSAVASRWGGEEFLIAIPSITLNEGIDLANKIHTSLKNNAVNKLSHNVNLTISIGVIQCDENRCIDLDIKFADELLYKAKEQGKNRTCSA